MAATDLFFLGHHIRLNTQQQDALAQGIQQVVETTPADFQTFAFRFCPSADLHLPPRTGGDSHGHDERPDAPQRVSPGGRKSSRPPCRKT